MNTAEAIYLAKLSGACTLGAHSLLPVRARPILISIWLTENCNSRCRMCDCWKSAPAPLISVERIDRVLADAESLGIRSVRFSGGEPMTRPDFEKIIGLLDRRSFRKAVLATNGLLMEPHVEAINRSALTQLTISLDGTREVHDMIRGIPGYYDKVVSLLPRLTKKIKITSLLTRHLVSCLDELLRLVQERGYEFEFGVPHRKAPPFYDSSELNASVEDLMPSDEEREAMFATLAKHGFANDRVIASSRALMTRRELDFDHCINPYTTLLVYWNGEVRAGCFAFEPVGNVNVTPLGEILASARHAADAGRAFRMSCPRNCAGSSQSTAAAAPLSSLGYALWRMR